MPRDLPDLTKRLDPAVQPELMDEPCPYETFRDTVCDLGQLNRLLRAYPPVLRFLRQALASRSSNLAFSHPKPQQAFLPLHILDVGSGGGDTLRHIARWARKHHFHLQLTGIDLNPHATRAAAELSAGRPASNTIRWVTGDVFTHPGSQSPDLVLSSLVTHHMRDDEIVRFLRWMEAHASRGWFISDLLRSPRSYRIFGPLSRLMRWHPYVKHDGLVSIRRAFREADWRRLLAKAGIPEDSVHLHRSGIGRLSLTRLR